MLFSGIDRDTQHRCGHRSGAIPGNSPRVHTARRPWRRLLSPVANRTTHIEYPAAMLDDRQQTPAEFERDARLAMAIKPFKMKRVSSGQAARLAGLYRTTFLMRLAEHGVAVIDVPPTSWRTT
jgi:predicted HTH domain antitoxin